MCFYVLKWVVLIIQIIIIKDENSLHSCHCVECTRLFYWYNATDLTNVPCFVICPTALFSQQPLSTLPLDRSLFVIVHRLSDQSTVHLRAARFDAVGTGCEALY